jgi:enterochelin esterase family protein
VRGKTDGVATSDLGKLLGLAGDIRIDFIDAPALRGNPIGDPSTRPLAVYLPPEFDPQGSKRYGVVYVMHGYTGDVAALVSARPWETNVVQWIDRLIVAKEMPPVLLAIVDGNNRFGGSQYVDSIHNGNYATYVVRDAIGHVDATYPTIANEGGRAIVGKSTGGFAAMYLSMTFPGTFCAFASHSGDTNFLGAYVPEFAKTQRLLERHDGDIRGFVETFEAKPKKSNDEGHAMMLLGQAAAYSPRAAEAWAIDLPFDLATGEYRPDVMARWLAYDPIEIAPGKRDELARLRLRYVDCGRRDEYGLDLGARIFARRVRDLGLDVRHEEFDDDHRNVGYRYAVSLPALARVLETG